MAKTKRKAGKRGTTADRDGLRARKSGVSKAGKPGLRRPKSAHRPDTARLKRQLKAARMQQEASAEILRAVANASGDAAGPLQQTAETTARLFGASSVSIQLAEGSEFTQEYRVGAIAKRVGSAYPRSNIKVGGRNLPGTVVAESRQIHIPDLDHLDPTMSDFPGLPHARAGGARTVCGTPLRREGKAIGALIVFRDRLLPFTDDELALQQSFADQAVIAIQNARLFNETREALERQTATADILRVISVSPTDVQPVFDALVLTARRLLRRELAFIIRRNETTFRPVAIAGPEGLVSIKNPTPIPINPSANFPSRAIVSKQSQQFPDWSAIDLPEEERQIREMYGVNSALYLPMLRGGECIGVLGLGGRQPGNFSEADIALAESFCDQALIAIENVRLFEEVQAKTGDLEESLQQQIATADVLKVISRSAFDLDSVMHTLARSAAELCAAGLCGLYIREGGFLVCRGYTAISKEQEEFVRQARISADDTNYVMVRALSSGEIANIGDFENDRSVATRAFQERLGFRSLLVVPLMREGHGIGLFVLGRDRVGEFSLRHIELVQTFADQAVIAIENARLFDEVQAKTRDLSEALEQQTATSEVLAVISRSPSDLNPVLEAISDTAARLCGSEQTMFFRYDGAVFRILASWNFPPEVHEMIERRPLMPGHPSAIGRAGASLKPVCIPDVLADPDYGLTGEQSRARYRATLAVPLLREGRLIGALSLNRSEPGAFTEKQIELVTTFADQAVIAIENVRLFDEVQAKTRDLAESLEHQTATSEVLQAIGGSMADSQPVFERILDSTHRLFDCRQSAIFLAPGDGLLHMAARRGDGGEALDRIYPQPIGETSAPVVIGKREQIYYPDAMNGTDVPESLCRVAQANGNFSVVLTPMLWDGQGVGFISVTREPNTAFHEKELGLLKTFADQAVIAIENARLFEEVQAKTRELAARNDAFRERIDYQSATIDVLKTMSASPGDAQPVFDLIVEQAEAVCGADAAGLLELDGTQVHLRSVRGKDPAAVDAYRASFPRPLSRDSIVSRAMLEAKIVYLNNAVHDTELSPQARGITGNASLGVPIIRDGVVIGGMGMTTANPNGFSEGQIELLNAFAEQAAIAIASAETFRKLQERTRELSQSLDDLRTAQDRLVQTEKLASLGQLTAGIAHEIKNPLNFVNNFSALSAELVDEMTEVFENSALDEAGRRKELDEIRELLKSNLEKVVQHGKRADSIVKNMLLHSREGSGERRASDLNALVSESLNLAYHGARAERSDFNITLEQDLDPDAGAVEVYPQELTRALLNLISNGFYAATRRKIEADGETFEPVLSAATRNAGEAVEIRIRDNGTGIPPEIREKIFNPFFTTKPTGEGTGLGLSMSHDIIVKQHGGSIDVDTEPGLFTEFKIVLPRTNQR